MNERIGFGGGCHWCTEAVFQQLRGVALVEQGWASAQDAPERFSEAVVVHYHPHKISLEVLVRIHLLTHSCTSRHALRGKYRSAVYCFDNDQQQVASFALSAAQSDFDEPILTEVVSFAAFRHNQPKYLNYYASDLDRPFCKTYISPKLAELKRVYGERMK